MRSSSHGESVARGFQLNEHDERLDFGDLAERQVYGEEIAVRDPDSGFGMLALARPVAVDDVEAVAGNRGENHLTIYFREVSTLPFLTPQREAELAGIIRNGQDELVRIVENHARENEIFADLSDTVHRLLEKEKEFPGVRDKVLSVTVRTLEHAKRDWPGDSAFSLSLTSIRTIMKAVEAAKQEMVRANLRLVLSIAKRYVGRGMSFDDLIQEGNVGLIKAAGRYDHTRGNRFSTYATWWIKQSIIRGIYDKTRTVRLPVHLIELKNCLFKVYCELLKELGRPPTPDEMSERSNLSMEKVLMMLSTVADPISLEAPIRGNDLTMADAIEDVGVASPEENCCEKELVETARSLLSSLRPREEKILRLRFGLEGHQAETLETIGKTLHLSKERIRQIEKRALRKLKEGRQACLRHFLQ